MKNKIICAILLFFVFIDVLLICISLSISPVKIKRDVFVFQYGEDIPVDVKYYVNANESILDNISLDLSNVLKEVGQYDASLTYFNETIEFSICVEDTIKPKATLKNVEHKIAVNEEVVAKDLIETIDDLSSTSVYFYNEDKDELVESKTYIQSGSYVEKIVVEDRYGNKSAVLRVKIVVLDNRVPPVIYGANDIIIPLYDEIDLYKGVKVIDDVEGDITYRLVVKGDVDNGIEGEYIVVYSVKDSASNETVVERKVTVR